MIRLLIALLLTGAVQAETLTLVPNTSNSNYTPVSDQLVTIGIPFAPCEVTALSAFRLLDDTGVEVPVFVKQTLHWPDTKACGVESTRAIKVQFKIDATAGERSYTWDLTGRTTTDISEQPVAEVASSLANRAGYNEPVVFGILDPSYLVQTELTTPTTVANANVFDTGYYPAKFNAQIVTALPFETDETQYWLLDTVSAIYKQAIRRGELEQYRQGYLNYKFYVDNIITVPVHGYYSLNCSGGWGMHSNGYCSDAKLIYTELHKLHIALTGNDEYVAPENSTLGDTLHEIIGGQVAYLWNKVTYAPGFKVPYTSRSSLYTERHAGISLISMLNACQITRDPVTCERTDTAIDNIYLHNIDSNGVWDTPYAGYNKHSWFKHEASQQPWMGIVDSVVDADTYVLRDTIGSTEKISVGNVIDVISDAVLTGQIYQAGGQWRVPVSGGVGANVEGGIPVYAGSVFIGRAQRLTPPDTNVFYLSGVPASVDLTSFPVGTALRINQVGHPIVAISDNGNNTWTVDTALSTSTIQVNGKAAAKRGDFYPDTDEAFSPWMADILVDGLWQYYHWSDDEARKAKAAHVMLGYARAMISFAIDGTSTQPATIAAIESAFSDWPTTAGIDIIKGVPDYEYARAAPHQRYVASYWMASDSATQDFVLQMNESAGYQKQHSSELLHTMAVGMYFETDPAKRAAMALVAEQTTIWYDEYEKTHNRGPIRSFPWEMRSDPYGTWQFVANVAGEPIIPLPVEPVPVDPPVVEPPVIDEPADTGSATLSISVTAVGSGYWRVLSGDDEISQHTAERESIESAVNVLLADPDATVTIRHDATYTVTAP